MLNYIIIIFVLIVFAAVVIKASKPDFKYEANKLVENLDAVVDVIIKSI